ncbi:sugar transferase [Achromobacter sp. CF-sbj1-Ac2-l]|uniref:UDP-glucose:undecaprenyl-phosphate glucose-1-phosphate transferase n=1 Tax=Achromobacter dolens TaxID=1287738 RepID=A0A6S7E6M9_9BURK|nr:sugar transferase [Achromobacter dolens]CAB3898352.1 UDP-glucose:undecaprenyl-phosphate glucose-1-phosphate transferase [Achromobacter dolens]CUI29107.1 Putative colanic biosynthesis UDP-glucose lipid carrier transferase [Achromobacter dolens]
MKRLFDLTCATIGLLVCAPVFALIALAVKLDSPGPVFFRQVRVGRNGRPFRIHKFRSMHIADKGQREITVNNDPRVTRSGKLLRKWKLDELPQLIDVLRGAMSLVGPRPEVPRYVELYPSDMRSLILSVRPGITDLASIQFRDENTLLDQAGDPEAVYIHQILPEKLRLQAEYVRERSFFYDLRILWQTVIKVIKH